VGEGSVSANKQCMSRFPVILSGLTIASVAAAQSNVDRLPALAPTPEIPLQPSPSNDLNDAPPNKWALPEPLPEAKEPPTQLLLAGPDTDTLTRHLLTFVAVGYRLSFGYLDSDASGVGTEGSGPELSVGAAYGVSRNIDIGLYGSIAKFWAISACDHCIVSAYDGTVFLGYHLVQGMRFDPWLRVGVGISSLHVSTPAAYYQYFGPSWLAAGIGGDWHATRNVAIGPQAVMAFDTFPHRPRQASGAIVGQMTLGFRVTFDAKGR
jgi:hypothetical protein